MRAPLLFITTIEIEVVMLKPRLTRQLFMTSFAVDSVAIMPIHPVSSNITIKRQQSCVIYAMRCQMIHLWSWTTIRVQSLRGRGGSPSTTYRRPSPDQALYLHLLTRLLTLTIMRTDLPLPSSHPSLVKVNSIDPIPMLLTIVQLQ